MDWKIKINVQKTQMITFKTNQPQPMQLRLFGQQIQDSHTVTILGVIMERSLSLKKHCYNLRAKAIQRLKLLKMIGGRNWGASVNTKRNIQTTD